MLTWPFCPETYDWLVALWHPHVFRPVSALLRNRCSWHGPLRIGVPRFLRKTHPGACRTGWKHLRANLKLKLGEQCMSTCDIAALIGCQKFTNWLNEEGALGSSFWIPHGLKVENANTHDSYPSIMLPGTPNHPSARRIPFIWHKNCVGQWNSVVNDKFAKELCRNVGAQAWFPIRKPNTNFLKLDHSVKIHSMDFNDEMTQHPNSSGQRPHVDGQDQSIPCKYLQSPLQHFLSCAIVSQGSMGIAKVVESCCNFWMVRTEVLVSDLQELLGRALNQRSPQQFLLCDSLPRLHGHCRG